MVSVERDLAAIRLPRWGRVEPAEGVVPWLVVDDNGDPVRPVRIFLMDFVAQANGASSVRSYAYALLRWWRWLHAVGVSWDRVTPAEARDLVLWLKQARKRRNSARTSSLKTAGTLNPITGKYYLDDRYAACTIRHSNAVVRAFYQYWIELGEGPVVNPVGLVRRHGSRGNAHHNPLEPFRPEGRLRYNPRLPKRLPREISDDRWRDLFTVLRSNRDRALLSLAISCAARAAEILGVRLADLDWGEQKVRVLRKGTGTAQWLPASPEAFVWIRLYLADLGDTVSLQDPLWQTLRRRDLATGCAGSRCPTMRFGRS
ncbi:tyrosine-type recombinase/integrase [Nocardia carnea]|uniref:tyrosine-type recombinase/integrase n=1 Tax=Nocardia carnea TaxID=37328 RepID=UPI001E456074|nr:site-specific integrase [Nocardia carnea]